MKFKISTILISMLLTILIYVTIIGVIRAESIKFASNADVLIVEHTYDGPVERVGKLINFQYTATYLYVEFYDDQSDGIFRNGFD